MADFVDLHSHYLPGIDDGAKTIESSMRMIEAVAALGFRHLQATPHQRAGMYLPSREQIDGAFTTVWNEAQQRTGPRVELGLGAENFWDEVLHRRLFEGTEALPTYNGSKTFLFELNTRQFPPRLEALLFELRMAGWLPVMAHPERYAAIQEDVGRAEALGRCAALVVDLGALDGAHGRAEMKAARRLLQDGLAHAAATDIHTPEDQRPVAAGMAWIKKHLGEGELTRLLGDNPRAILAGELP